MKNRRSRRVRVLVSLTPSEARRLDTEAVGRILADEESPSDRKMWERIHDAIRKAFTFDALREAGPT